MQWDIHMTDLIVYVWIPVGTDLKRKTHVHTVSLEPVPGNMVGEGREGSLCMY